MKRWCVIAFAAVLVFLVGPPARAVEQKEKQKKPAAAKGASKPSEAGKKFVLTEPAVFTMEEAPAFGKVDVAGAVEYRIPRGPLGAWTNAPSREVKAYPKLKSKRPLYGSVRFGGDYYERKPGTTYQFVLDESGEAAKEAEGGKANAMPVKTQKKTAETKNTPSLPVSRSKSPGAASSPAARKPFAADLACTYDRLYFDLNGDRDLTNDGVITAAEKPVFDMRGVTESPFTRYFNDLAVVFDFGAPVGKRPFVLVPLVRVYAKDRAYVQFVPKTARKGKVRLGDEEYVVWLTQSSSVSGRYDRPFVQLDAFPTRRTAKEQPLLKSGPLGYVRTIDEQFLIVSASPLGDTLTITPHQGDIGVLELGAGGRAITEFGLVGQLVGPTMIVPLGPPYYYAPENLPRRYKVPVGDYMLPAITAQYGRLRFSARMTSTVVARPGEASRVEYAVQIRKDKPYVLEFSGKPEVKFASPNSTLEFKRGDAIYIAAMLNEPWQKIQITGLWDTTEKKETARYPTDDGSWVTVPKYAELDPTIVVRSPSGKEVATGKMPFG